MQLTNKLTQLDTREDSLFALIGHPEWDTKLNQHMRNLRTEKSDTQRQLVNMNTALETGRDLLLTGLAMLVDPRQVYDNGPDEIKTTMSVCAASSDCCTSTVYAAQDGDAPHATETGHG